MRRLISLCLASVLVIATALPVAAKMATIQTIAPLRDHEEQSVKNALREAVRSAVTSALAMGLPWVRLRRAVVLQDAVAVQVLATDTDPKGETGGEVPTPDDKLLPGVDDSSRTEF
jgi:hypothetical protein